MPRYFEHDLESGKLNIYTGGKAEWVALPSDKRDDIKRFCLWSKTRECWVSKGKAEGCYWLLKTLCELAFEDRGKVGEKLSIQERIEAQQERAADRAERMADRAGQAEERSNQHHKTFHDMMDAIPFGQPILIGHHSEQRDRNYRERACNHIGKAVAEADKAKYYERRAATARATADGAKYADPAFLGNRIKECETNLRQIEARLQGKFYLADPPKEISEEQRVRWQEKLDEETAELEFYRHCLEASGKVVYGRETLKGKQAVKIRGRWEMIVKLNPTTVAVPNTCFPLEEHQRKYALKYAYTEVQEAR